MLIGLVGKPSVGKSTFFKSATLANVAIASYPFTTIKPNHGIGYVKIDCVDKEFKVQCQPRMGYCVSGKRFVPVELMDVAGLVEGASEGKGLGNQFLDDLRQADCFIQIVDISGTTDAGGKEGKGNPIEDVKMLENEVDMWYFGILKKVWKVFSRTLQQKKEDFAKAVAKQFSGLKVNENDIERVILKSGLNTEKAYAWTEDELKKFAHTLRVLTKPMIIAANKIDKSETKENLEKLKKEFPDCLIVPCSADSELALREASKAGLISYVPGEASFEIKKTMSEKQKNALEVIKKNVLEFYGSTGVQGILNTAVFSLLEYIAVFPVENAHHLSDSKGSILPDCYLLPSGSSALNLAFAVHTDIGNNFVKAIDACTGKPVGKEHKLKHREVLEIATK